MRRLFFLCLLCVGLSCKNDKDQTAHVLDFVPENTFALIKSNSLTSLKNDVQNNSFLKGFSNTGIHQFLSENVHFLEYLQPQSEVLFAFSENADSTFSFTLITPYHEQLFKTDSIADVKVETLTKENFSAQKITISDDEVYTAVVNNVFVMSASMPLLENLIAQQRNKSTQNQVLQQIYGTSQNNALTVFIKTAEVPLWFGDAMGETATMLSRFSSWMAVDADILPGEIKLSGIAVSQDTIPRLMDVFKGTVPQKNELAKVTPVNSKGFVSVTYNDFEILNENLNAFRSIPDSLPIHESFFKSLNEVGVIYTASEKVLAVHAIDGSITAETVMPFEETLSSYRDVAIKKFADSTIFNRVLHPLLPKTQTRFFAQLDDFFVFANSTTALEAIITDYTNETTLNFRPFYKDHFNHMSDASSLLLVGLNEQLKKELPALQSAGFGRLPLAALQFVYDNHYAHIHGVVKEASLGSRTSGVSQLLQISLENELLNTPQFFSNHLTKGKDIVVQDVSNQLHLIAANGRTLWNRRLDGPILGEIHEIDMYKNGRVQMAFSTEKTLYVLDRNGNDVAPFPLKFKDAITQPLAVFDYDNNRNYRLLITQGNEILMYDAKGKTVSGFTFKKAGSALVLPPQHIRIGNKDYLLFAESGGKLNILSRTGSSRISVSEKFDFGSQPIVSENEGFVFYTNDGKKVHIDQSGKVTKEQLSSTSSAYKVVRGRTQVTLEDYVLQINNRRIELPFGMYEAPVISVSNQRILIAVTDRQENRVYVYNSQGQLLPNFPVYGTSVMELGDANNNGRPNGVVKGNGKNVVLYEIN